MVYFTRHREPRPRDSQDYVRAVCALVLAAMLSAGGCGGSGQPASPTPTPSAASPVGSWSGTLSDPVSGEGAVLLTIGSDSLGFMRGTWSVTFRSGESFSGPAAATLLPTETYGLTLYVDPPPACATGSGSGDSTLLSFSLINVVVTSSRLTGVAGRFSCSGFAFGTVSLSRQ